MVLYLHQVLWMVLWHMEGGEPQADGMNFEVLGMTNIR